MQCNASDMIIVVRPSHPYNAGTEHVGFSPTKQISLAPSTMRREVFGESYKGRSAAYLLRTVGEGKLFWLIISAIHRHVRAWLTALVREMRLREIASYAAAPTKQFKVHI